MKILKTSLKIIGVIVAVALIAGVIVVSSLRKSGLPELNGEKTLSQGLRLTSGSSAMNEGFRISMPPMSTISIS